VKYGPLNGTPQFVSRIALRIEKCRFNGAGETCQSAALRELLLDKNALPPGSTAFALRRR
jgi:hypothetical protein